jgi:tRNA threonylcarbamoyladenosine dehydratase
MKISGIDTSPLAPYQTAPDLDRRFGGLVRLYGALGAQRIRNSHIVVVGLGGVGSWAVEAAARSGVGRLTLIDADHIAESNINRQVHAVENTLGQSKVHAMQERIASINPQCQVDCIDEFVSCVNWPDILPSGLRFGPDQFAVIDACDQVKAKTEMAVWAIHNKINFVSVGAAGGKRLAHRVEIDDLSAVTHDPLLAQLRNRLRKEKKIARLGKMNLVCVFTREPVLRQTGSSAAVSQDNDVDAIPMPDVSVPMQTDGSLNCHGYGSVVSVTATFGMCATSWVLNKIAI